jgi:GT2 family glycosyltransferase
LKSLETQTLAPAEYEVLVVDNASTDDTARVVERITGTYGPRLRYEREPELGLSAARNRGWATALGAVVFYLDDDAVASPGWLREARDVLRDDPEGRIAAVGGPVEPIWEVPRPFWLTEEIEGAVGLFAGGDWRRPVERLVGGNVAYRREILATIGGFSTQLGRRGAQIINGEDDDVHIKMRRAGFQLHYLPGMLVQHHVPVERLTQSYLRRWAYGSGWSAAQMRRLAERPGRLRRWLWAVAPLIRLAPSPRELAAVMRVGGAAQRFTYAFERQRRLGELRGYLR